MPDVDPLEQDDLVSFETGVQLRVVPERGGGRVDRERQEAGEVDTGEVAFLDEGHGGHLAMRARDLLDDRAPDASDGHAPTLLRRSRRGRRAADVRLHDAPARAASREPDQLHPELSGELADGGRRAHRRRRVGRDDRHERLPRGLAARGRPGIDGSEELLALLADHDEHRTHRRDDALVDEDLQHRPRPRRRDLDRRLVGLDLDERLILTDVVPLGDEPARDLRFGEALAQVGEPKLVGHAAEGSQNARALRIASTTRSTEGMYQSSSCQYGYGTS